MEIQFVPSEIKKSVPNWKTILKDCCDIKVDNKHLSQFYFNSMKKVKWVRHTMIGNREHAGNPEKLFAAFLYMRGIKFIPQAPFYITNRIGRPRVYYADFYLPKENVIVEIDGRAHYTPKGKEWDEERDFDFMGIGVKTYRFDNSITTHKSTLVDMPFIKEESPI